MIGPSGPRSEFADLGPTRAFPATQLITDRLLLRAYREDDVDEHLGVFDHDVARRWSIAPQPYPRHLARRWCTDTAEEVRRSGDGICWAVVDLATGRHAGLAGLHRTDWSIGVAEVSGTASATALGRGRATRVLRILSHWALVEQGLHALIITTTTEHRGVTVLARGCGYVEEPDTDPGVRRFRLDSERARDLPVPEYRVQTPSPSHPPTEAPA